MITDTRDDTREDTGTESLAYWQLLLRGIDIPDLSELLDRPRWHRHAACRGMGPELFFGGRATEDAKMVCAVCPVSDDCRKATPDPIGHGIWGGTTPSERRTELARSGRSPLPTAS